MSRSFNETILLKLDFSFIKAGFKVAKQEMNRIHYSEHF